MKKEKTGCGVTNSWWIKQMPLKAATEGWGEEEDKHLKGKQM